ncbi:hypothetical protein ACFLZI_03870, partial [Nitrospirota bacterium]
MKKLIIFSLLVCSLLLIGCSGDKTELTPEQAERFRQLDEEDAKQSESTDTSTPVPGTITASIVPAEATFGDILKLNVTGLNLDEAQVAWRLNGRPISTLRRDALDSSSVNAKKGDAVQVEVTAEDGRNAKSNIVMFRNTRPNMSYVKIMP